MDTTTIAVLAAIVLVLIHFFGTSQVEKPDVQVVGPGNTDSVDDVGRIATRPWIENKFHVGASRDEAAIRTNQALSAKAINDKNNVVRAEAAGISVQALQQMEVIEFQTDEEIRKHQATAVVDARIERVRKRNDLLNERFNAIHWIDLAEKVAIVDKKVEEIIGQRPKALPENPSPEAGGEVSTSEDE